MGLVEAVATAPAGDYWQLVIFSGGLSAAAIWGAFSLMRRARLVEDTPTARIRSAPQGFVELEGTARRLPGMQTRGALTNRICIWWSYKIQERRSSGKSSKWVTIDEGTSVDPFELDDGTGTCTVIPIGAKVLPSRKDTWRGRTRHPTRGPPRTRSWFALVLGGYRYIEERLDNEMPLYALGSFHTESGIPDARQRDVAVEELLRKWRHDPKMMKLLDADRDGSVDLREWRAARRMAQHRIESQHHEAAALPDERHLFSRPDDGRPLLLSSHLQEELIRRSRTYATGLMVSGSIGSVVFLWALLARGIL